MPDVPTLAQHAYEAYEEMLWLFTEGRKPPARRPWEALTHTEHAAWTYAMDWVEAYVRAQCQGKTNK